jgi:predicted phage-related endonuclease
VRAFVVIDAEQRSPEWFAARAGRLTGSVAGDMVAKIGKGEAAARRNLRLKLVLERVTGRTQESDFISPAMQAGLDREPLAFRAYEALTGEVVQRSGFVSHVSLMAGASLDGHIGDFDTLLSIKCRQPAAHLDFLRSGVIPADAMAQIRHELWITGASAHDYFSWNPDFPEDLQSRLVTVTRAQADVPSYEAEALKFLAEVDTEVAAIQTMRNPTAVLREAVAS